MLHFATEPGELARNSLANVSRSHFEKNLGHCAGSSEHGATIMVRMNGYSQPGRSYRNAGRPDGANVPARLLQPLAHFLGEGIVTENHRNNVTASADCDIVACKLRAEHGGRLVQPKTTVFCRSNLGDALSPPDSYGRRQRCGED